MPYLKSLILLALGGGLLVLAVLRLRRYRLKERYALIFLLLGLPLLEAKLRRLTNGSWLKDVSHFGGLWLHASGQLQDSTALQELRDLARGIHPAVLTDRGLDAALSSVAARCTAPVQVDVDLPGRPVPALEGIAYVTVSERLQNISKHASARSAAVDVWKSGERLLIQVSDDGRGGADPASGTGLAGLSERLDAVDGVLVVDSPADDGTTVTAELPWR